MDGIDLAFVGGPHDGEVIRGDRLSLKKYVGRQDAALSLGEDKHMYEIREDDNVKLVAHYIGKWPNLMK